LVAAPIAFELVTAQGGRSTQGQVTKDPCIVSRERETLLVVSGTSSKDVGHFGSTMAHDGAMLLRRSVSPRAAHRPSTATWR
jgi:hypothetical protein